jgi:uncharacterized iron-regulated membrane protein
VKIVLSIVAVIVGLVFGVHALTYVASPAGRCMLGQQPNILLGSALSLTVQLEGAYMFLSRRASSRREQPARTRWPRTG